MKICKFCNTMMMSEYESGRNSKSYTAFHNCLKCNATCDEKVIEYKGRREIKELWFNPTTKEYE